MGYRPQIRSSRSGRGHQKAQRKKAKGKAPKHQVGGKYAPAEKQVITAREVAEKTLRRLGGLGNQKFALSPFSEYFDNWLMNLKEVMSEFESNQAINADDEFVKERSQVIADVELKLSERRRDEAVLEKATRRLAKQNNLLVQTDTEYAYETQKLASQRNSEIKRLTRSVHDFEEELEEASRMKASIFSPFARRAKSHKTVEATRKLDAAKSELKSVVKSFEVEQEKLHDEYEKRKQTVIEQVRSLEKKVEGSETEGSVEDRRFACEELVNAVNALLQRKNSLPQ
jgi:hypothetical protein